MQAKAYNVALQVGVAGYRVDIAIRHPVMTGQYVLGISARDRDRLRQEALERLGWRLIRVWSTDWFRDPDRETARLGLKSSRQCGPCHQRRKLASPRQRSLTPNPAATRTAPPQPPSPPAPRALDKREPPPDLASALGELREEAIMREFPGSEPNRCILRDRMIEAIVRSQLDDPDDFCAKTPDGYERTPTGGRCATWTRFATLYPSTHAQHVPARVQSRGRAGRSRRDYTSTRRSEAGTPPIEHGRT
ncbi:MAG: hypothetical protein JOY71_06170 [Acetobacteraceae bacterium]|nr:hypothetical protein [Acetobacteraceae bacterium]